MNKVSLSDLLCNGSPHEALILCATSRLAQDLQRQYAQTQAAKGLARWPSLQVSTVDAWLQQLEEEWMLSPNAHPLPSFQKVLSETEVEWLFEDIIQYSLPSTALFDLAALAKDAAAAHAISTLWAMPPPQAPLSEEQQQFLDWQRAFKARCQARQWTDKASLQSLIAQSLHRMPMCLPRQLWFAGFDRYTPLEHAIESACRHGGIAVGELDLNDCAHAPEVRAYPDAASECLAAAQWAAAYLALHPQARLAWVVPDLNRLRDDIQDTLDQVMVPASLRIGRNETARPYNISLGRPLASYPLVRAAFDMLRMAFNPSASIEFDRLSALLLSVFWSQACSEGDARAVIDVRLREGRGDAMAWSHALKSVRYWADRLQIAVPNALQHLAYLAEVGQTWSTTRRLPSQWILALEQVLEQGGWLSGYELSSHEYQTRAAFTELLHGLGTFDEVLGDIDAHQVLRRLHQLCAQRVFQPQTIGQPALQVLGTLEASGLSFDALWIMGMNDSVWPAPAQPSPFLSVAWQRQQRTPNASSEVQWAFAESVTTRLLGAAPQVICSWSTMNKDSELRPSPMLKSWLPGLMCPAPTRNDWVAQAVSTAPNAFSLAQPDDRAPPVAEGEYVPGGTGLLKAQAICPAWAYYRYRLGAKKLNTPSLGLDSAARGSMVHQALCFFWRDMSSLAALQACSAEALSQHIEASARQALKHYNTQPGYQPLAANEEQLEFERLCKLLERWVAVEQIRCLPFRVIETEKSVQVRLEGLEMRLQIDRIDELDDGRWIVIDYKTGRSVDLNNWASARLTEPQLPLYAVMSVDSPSQVAGVVFGKVRLRRKEAGFAGLTADPELLPSVEAFNGKKFRSLYPESTFPDWSSVLQHWQARLHEVALEVRDGVASVTFDKESALQFCDVLPLLRLSEREQQLEQWLRGDHA